MLPPCWLESDECCGTRLRRIVLGCRNAATGLKRKLLSLRNGTATAVEFLVADIDGIRLVVETEPGLLFTCDGEAVDFRSPTPTWRNLLLRKN